MFTFMGRKIKVLAMIFTWLGIIFSAILGLISIIQGVEFESTVLVITGILAIFIGSLISWLSSFMLYGFGQIVDNTDKLVSICANNNRYNNSNMNHQTNAHVPQPQNTNTYVPQNNTSYNNFNQTATFNRLVQNNIPQNNVQYQNAPTQNIPVVNNPAPAAPSAPTNPLFIAPKLDDSISTPANTMIPPVIQHVEPTPVQPTPAVINDVPAQEAPAAPSTTGTDAATWEDWRNRGLITEEEYNNRNINNKGF